MDILIKIFVVTAVGLLFMYPLWLYLYIKKNVVRQLGKSYRFLKLRNSGRKAFFYLYIPAALIFGFNFYVTGNLFQMVFWVAWLTGSYLYNVYAGYGIYYNDEKFVFADLDYRTNVKAFEWTKIDSAEWDKDVGQQNWGLRIYYNGSRNPVRYFFIRKEKDRIDELFIEKTGLTV